MADWRTSWDELYNGYQNFNSTYFAPRKKREGKFEAVMLKSQHVETPMACAEVCSFTSDLTGWALDNLRQFQTKGSWLGRTSTT